MIDGLLSLGAAGLSAWTDTEISKKNLEFQRKNLDYLKSVQRTTWEREDNAVQRRIADLKAAGLSPTLAAGSSAQASAPIRTEPLEYKGDPVGKGLQAASVALSMMREKAEISRTLADKKLAEDQAWKARQEGVGQMLANEYATAANPISLNLKRIDQWYAEESVNQRLNQLFQEVKKSGFDAQYAELKRDVEKENLTQAQLKTVRDKIENEEAAVSLSEKQIELATMQVALDINKKALEEGGYNLEVWKRLGLPTNAGLDLMTRGGAVVGNALGELLGGRK